MSEQRPSRIVWWLRATIVVGVLLVATGVGGMVFDARRKVAAIDCLSGASPPSSWEFDQRGPEAVRSLVGERGAMMFLDTPRALTFGDTFTRDQARALRDLPSLRSVEIGFLPSELLGELQGLAHLDQLILGSDVPIDEIHAVRTSLPDCDIIYRYWDGSDWRVITISREELLESSR